MKNFRCAKLEKYMDFTITNSICEKLPFEIISQNIFYGINKNNKTYKLIKEDEFESYEVVLRLLNNDNNFNSFRVLKSNENEKVDFEEEVEMLKSKIKIKFE